MNTNDYFSIAKILATLNQSVITKEICYRTAINRLYYGIFHLIQERFKIIVPEAQKKRCHEYVKQ